MNNIILIYVLIALFPICIYLSISRPFVFPLGLYVLLLPFDSILAITGATQGATLTKFLGILTIPVLFIKGGFENRLKKPNSASIWWIFFVIYSISSIAWSIVPEKVLTRIPTLIGLFVLYLIASSYKPYEKELETLKKYIVIGGLIASIISIYFFFSGQFLSGNLGARGSLAIGARSTNPNLFAFTLLLHIAYCLGMISNQTQKLKGLYAASLSVMIISIVITGSRGGMIGMAIFFIVYILIAKQKITAGIILIISGIIILLTIQGLFMERWSIALGTGGAGRLTIWYIGLMALSKYWLFGSGLENFPVAYNEFVNYASNYTYLNMDAHNTYLRMIVELGIIGFLFWIIGIVKHYWVVQKHHFQEKNDRVILLAAFFAILISSFFSTFIWTKSFWLLWIMIMLHINVIRDDSESEIEMTS